MCNHHHNLEYEHMTFKVVQIAHISEDSPELIGNQKSLSWYAKQEYPQKPWLQCGYTQRILHIICCVWKCRTGRTRYTVLNCYQMHNTGVMGTKLKNIIVWGNWLNISGTEISASSHDRLNYICLSFQDTALHSLSGTGCLVSTWIFLFPFLIPWLCVNKNTLNIMRYTMSPPVLIVLPVFGKHVSRATILHRS